MGPKIAWGALVLGAWACHSARPTDTPFGVDRDLFGDHDGGGGDPDPGPTPLCRGNDAFITVGSAATLDPIIEDPERCMLYGVDRTATQVYFIDVDTDSVRTVVPVGAEPVDLTLSADGAHLYVAVLGASAIVVLDTDDGALVDTFATTLPPYRIARGTGPRVYYVEESGFTGVREVDIQSGLDTEILEQDFHEPDLDASPDGTTLYLGEANLAGSRLFRFDAINPALPEIDEYRFEGGFTLPTPKRHIQHVASANRVYFADRAFRDDELPRMLGWFADQVLAATSDGKVVATGDALFDAQTFVRIAARPHPHGGVLFSSEGAWLYEFDAVGSLLRRTRVSNLTGDHELGAVSVAPGVLADHRFNQLVADRVRPLLYGLNSQKNQLVVIDTPTLMPIRAEIIGSAPTDIALTADGARAIVATFGATELAVLDLGNEVKLLADTIRVPGNPFRVTLAGDRLVYAEQDQTSDMAYVDTVNETVVASLGTVFQPDVELDPSGRYLYAGESAGPAAYLRRFDLDSGDFVAAGVTTASYAYPSRRLFYHSGALFYAEHKFDAETLAELGDFGADIVALSPDGRFALSRRHIYDADTFGELGVLPTDSNLVAVDAASATVYQFDNEIGAIFVQALPAE